MAALSPTTPPKGFVGKNKRPVEDLKKKKSKPVSSFASMFGKK